MGLQKIKLVPAFSRACFVAHVVVVLLLLVVVVSHVQRTKYVHETEETYTATQLNFAKLTKEPSALLLSCIMYNRAARPCHTNLPMDYRVRTTTTTPNKTRQRGRAILTLSLAISWCTYDRTGLVGWGVKRSAAERMMYEYLVPSKREIK